MNKMVSEYDEQGLVIYFFGEIDSSNVTVYKVKICDLLNRYNPSKLIFDFSDVSFVDSAGIGLILGRYNELKLSGGKLILCGVKSEIMKIFKISGLVKLVDCLQESML